MKLQNSLADAVVLVELGNRLARRRIELSLTQTEMAKRAGIGKRTLERIEAGCSAQTTGLIRILRELGLLEALDALLPEEGLRPIDLMKLKGKSRRRASSASAKNRKSTWTWGDES